MKKNRKNRSRHKNRAVAPDPDPPNRLLSQGPGLRRIALALCRPSIYRPIIVCIAVALLTLLLVPKRRTIDMERYRIGDIARADLWAAEEVTIEDEETTQKNRKAEAEKVPPVYDYDEQAVGQTVEVLRTTFASLRESLAKRNQLLEALRQSSQAHLETQETTSAKAAEPGRKTAKPTDQQPAPRPEIKPTLDELRDMFNQQLGVDLSRKEFDLLVSSGLPASLEGCISEGFASACKDSVVADKNLLISGSANGVLVREVKSGLGNVLPANVVYTVPDVNEAMSRAARLVGTLCPDFTKLHSLLAKIVSGLIKPTLTFNKSQTEKNKEEVMAAVEPVYYKIKKGQMIIRAREMVTPKHHKIIEAMFTKKEPRRRVYSAIGTPVFLAIVVVLMYMLGHRFGFQVRPGWKSEALFWVILVSTVFFAKGFLWGVRSFVETIERPPFNEIEPYYFATPLGLSSVLATLLLGRRSGMAAAVLTAAIVPLLFGSYPVIMMVALLSGLGVVFVAERYQSGALVFKMGLSIGIIAAATVFSMQILDPKLRFTASGNFNVLCGLGQALVVIASAGILLPILELVFGVWTKAKLLELASSDKPLMKRLMIEAGGTHNHSLRVAELARNACEAVGANGVVALVSSYYHDIGKLKRPGYFIENTPVGGTNPHDNLRPEMSARILREHVAYGTKLAKEHNLPPVIIDAIQQHHGMSLMRAFYHKAVEKAKQTGELVNEADFRYPGPKPKTRERGIILIADSVEAASRVLVSPTRDKIAKMVERIVVWYVEDHQLDECGLTLKEIAECKKSFASVLEGTFHSRVEYPKEEVESEDDVY